MCNQTFQRRPKSVAVSDLAFLAAVDTPSRYQVRELVETHSLAKETADFHSVPCKLGSSCYLDSRIDGI